MATTAAAATTLSGNTSTQLATSRLADSEQTFLKLLTVQLKNQDPTSPLDTNQFTNQIVSMTGVEQQIQTNKLLGQMTNNGSSGISNAVSMIGKDVTSATSNSTLTDTGATWNYNVLGVPANVVLTVTNSQGETVWSGPPTQTAGGDQVFTWNGVNTQGRKLPSGGKYTLSVAATDAQSGSLTTSVSIKGTATAVETTDGVVYVVIGKTSVPLSTITSVAPVPPQPYLG